MQFQSEWRIIKNYQNASSFMLHGSTVHDLNINKDLFYTASARGLWWSDDSVVES